MREGLAIITNQRIRRHRSKPVVKKVYILIRHGGKEKSQKWSWSRYRADAVCRGFRVMGIGRVP